MVSSWWKETWLSEQHVNADNTFTDEYKKRVRKTGVIIHLQNRTQDVTKSEFIKINKCILKKKEKTESS